MKTVEGGRGRSSVSVQVGKQVKMLRREEQARPLSTLVSEVMQMMKERELENMEGNRSKSSEEEQNVGRGTKELSLVFWSEDGGEEEEEKMI